jgi:hypothetical protein
MAMPTNPAKPITFSSNSIHAGIDANLAHPKLIPMVVFLFPR